jgi:hypothetical protein
VLVWRSRFGLARASAALAVAAIVAGWAVAQRPRFLPGLTVSQAAAGRSTLIVVVITVAIGAVVLVPARPARRGPVCRASRGGGKGHRWPGGVTDQSLSIPAAVYSIAARRLRCIAVERVAMRDPDLLAGRDVTHSW